ncbi:MAG: helix-turn-helix transcriptional regulator [bacterium]
MQKSARLLKVWKLCRQKKYMTAPKLAQACRVTERQIYRDINSLLDLGVTISMNGGYRIVGEDPLPQLNFTPAERMVLTMALRALPLHQDKELENIANSLFNKLLDRPEGENLAIFEPTALSKTKGRSFARLQKAIDARCYVTLINYVKFDNTILPERKIAPYYLVHRDRHWYVIAWSDVKQDFQTYRLDRIGKLRVGDETYTPRPFDPDEYFRGTVGMFVDQPQRLRVRFTGVAKEIVRKGGRVAPENLHDEEDALILDMIMRGEVLWLRWLIGFGGEAEILEPEGMRAKAKKMLREGVGRYAS